jgi:stress response protein YsnF
VERRRPVSDRSDAPAGAFEERVVEVHESEEVPVAQKRARVVEEVAITREETERTKRVQDTVRRDEVDISKDPSTEPGRGDGTRRD